MITDNPLSPMSKELKDIHSNQGPDTDIGIVNSELEELFPNSTGKKKLSDVVHTIL